MEPTNRVTMMVTGSRGIDDKQIVWRCLDFVAWAYELLDTDMQALPIGVRKLIHGGARGVDFWADQWAVNNWVPDIDPAVPDWDAHGKAAGPIRNKEMVDQADLVVGIWDGQSRGTGGTLTYARQQQKNMIVFIPSDNLCKVHRLDPQGNCHNFVLDISRVFEDQMSPFGYTSADTA